MKWGHLVDPLLMVSALSLGVYLATSADAPTQSELDARVDNVLPAFSPEDIIEIRWSHPHAFSIHKASEADSAMAYVMGNENGLETDEEAVRSLLRTLDLASFKRVLGSGAHVDADGLGFRSPRLELAIVAGPRSYRIVAGNEAPTPKGTRYLKVEGTNVDARVGVVEESLVLELEKSEQEFLGGLVFPLARSETAKLSIAHAGNTVRLAPDEDAFYVTARAGDRVLADRELVDLLFFQLARTKIETYLPNVPEAPMLATVRQTGTDGVTYTAKLGAPCPDQPLSITVHRTEPSELVGCAPRSVLAAYLVSQDELYSLTATEMNPDEIDHVTVQYEDRTLDLLRDGHGYALLGEDKKGVPSEAGDEFLEALATSRHSLEDARPEGAERVGRLTLKGQVRNTAVSAERDRSDHVYEGRLEIYSKGEALFLHRLADDSWLEVSEENEWPYLAYSGWARDRLLAHFSASELEEVTVVLPTGASWTVRREEGGFLLEDTEKNVADPSLSRDLFEQIASLEALRFITPPIPRPNEPLLHLRLDVVSSGTRKEHNLWVGGRVRGGYLGWSDLAEGTFVLPYGLRSLLERPLIDRRTLRIDLNDQDRVEIETDGRRFVFQREGGLLRATGGDATEDMLEPLTAALSSLRVISAAGDHPSAKNIERGEPVITIRTKGKGEERALELHLGKAVVWQGLSSRTAWLRGSDETFFVEQSSMEELLELL